MSNIIISAVETFKRTAYEPVTEAAIKSFSTHSKFGGFPYIRNKEDWPVCPNCSNHMQLLLQLNMNDLPINKEDALIQLFYCTNSDPLCEVECEAWNPVSKSKVCRRVVIEQPSFEIEPFIHELFEEKRIVGWTEADDYPGGHELRGFGIDTLDYYDELAAAKLTPKAGDKLYGWPVWIHSVEYPLDSKTGSKMELLFQFDSRKNLPFSFGSWNIGYLTRSKDNPDEVAFIWESC